MGTLSHIEPTEDIAKLDIKDKKILSILVQDCRMPLGRIAKQVHLSRDGVAYRIRQLMKKKVIQGFVPVLSYRMLGFFRFCMYLLVSERSEKTKKELLDYLKASKNVLRILEFSDRWDYELVLITKTIEDFIRFKQELDEKYSDLILEEEHVIVAERNATSHLPAGFYEQPSQVGKTAKVDSTDIAILQSLADNARKPYYTMGEELGIDADTVRNRVKNMFKCGVIKRLAAVINISRLNYNSYIFIANMRYINKKDNIRLRNLVATNQNIIEILQTIGPFDLIIHIAVENPLLLHTTIKQFKMQFSHTIKNHLTLVTYHEHHYKPVLGVISDLL